jgi:protein TonB
VAHLEKGKRYPAGARGERGVAYVRFSIDAAGKVLSASLAGSSGHPEFDGEALSLVRRASPVPAPPLDANRTITAPVRFNAR